MDRLIYYIIKIIPHWIKPNHLSIFRIVMVGPIVILLLIGQNIIATIIFIFTVLLDTFDGVLARVRLQKTKDGEWLDPLADKFLIIGVLWFYGLRFLPFWLVLVITILESLLVLGRPIKIKLGISTKANSWGKIKMTIQSIAVIGLITGIGAIKPIVIFLLLIALCFAVLSLFSHIYDILNFKFYKTMSVKKHFTTEEAKMVGETLGIKWDKFDIEQFRMGMDIELEHGLHDSHTNVTNNDSVMTGKIALAHLNEFPDYYTRLEKMEKEAEEFYQRK